MSLPVESDSKELLRDEFNKRVREASHARDWNSLEHWSKQWVQLDSKHPDAFKWLARSAVALNKIQKAAYAYGRLLDYDKQNEEAKNFFSKHPSSLEEKPEKRSSPLEEVSPAPLEKSHLISPEGRQKLSESELNLARLYEDFGLFAQSAARYLQSFEWYPSQTAALGVARSYHSQRQGLEAIRFLREQLYYFPNWIEGRVLLGRILFELGKNTEAQKEWQIVLQQEPNHSEALNFLRGLYTSSAL